MLLVVVEHAPRLHARDDALERRSRSRPARSLAAPRRAAKIAASLQMLARSAPVSPLVCWATRSEVDVRRAACRACAPPGCRSRPFTSGGATKTWRSKRPGRSSAGSSFSRRFEAAITTTSSLVPKPSISTSSWLSVWSFSPETSLPRAAADGVELVDEDDRRARSCAPRGTAAGCAPRRGRRTSPRTTPPTGRRTSRPTRGPRPWRAGSCRCRAGRAAGPPWAPWRRAP